MSETIYTQQGKLVIDSSFIPYIRRQDVEFEAENLRPGKVARLFLDEIVMNNFAQKGNKIVINSRKIMDVSANNALAALNDYVYQGSTNTAPTFSANVISFNSSTGTLTIDRMSGNFDDAATLYIENAGILITTAEINSFINANTADVFLKGEGVINQNNNTYMTVIGSSGENILYVNENYITANIDVAVGSLTSLTVDYKIGDIVYQTPAGNNDPSLASFTGKVVYYNPAAGGAKIALSTISGRLNTNNSTANVSSRIWNASNTTSKSINVINTALVDLEANNVLVSVANVANTLNVVSYVHHSGAFSNVYANTSAISGADAGGANVYINSSNASLAVGNIMYFTTGAGLGQLKRVVAVDGKRVQLNSALSIDPTHLTKYSIGNHIVDNNGNLSGILNIPEEPNFKFRSGERIFSITDTNKLSDNDYTMRATSKFVASGLLNRTQRIVTTPIAQPLPEFEPSDPVAPVTPSERTFNPDQPRITDADVPRRKSGDPIAQTFFTPKPNSNKTDNGIFVTSVDLFFGAKPSVANASLQLPVSVKLATVVNGFPTQNYVAISTVQAKDVKVSTAPSSSNASTYTKFTFPDPVYLAPDSEYALIVYSESPEYEVYIAELGGDVLGADPPRRISEQPYSGSFFRSQNSSTWTPYQNEDLMFVINKAVFTGSGSVTFNLKDAPLANQNVHRLFLHTNELTFPVGALDYKVKGIMKSSLTQESNFNYVKPHTVFRYGTLLDQSNKLASTTKNARALVLGNANSVLVTAEFVSGDSDISPVFNKESFSLGTGEYRINNAEMSNNIISITNRGLGYNAVTTTGNTIRGFSGNETGTALANAGRLFRQQYLADSFNVGLYAIAITGGQGANANGFAVANTTGSNTVDYIVITDGGDGYIENPTISIAKGNAASNIQAAATIQGETGKSGGNILSKYITRQFTLEDGFESGDMRLFMDVIRPNGTDIQVYYKVLGAEDPERFSDKNWVRMLKRVDRKSKDEREIIELEFRPNLNENILQYDVNGTKYPIGGKYKSFAIKVCMLSTDPTIVPLVRNLRIIATPEG